MLRTAGAKSVGTGNDPISVPMSVGMRRRKDAMSPASKIPTFIARGSKPSCRRRSITVSRSTSEPTLRMSSKRDSEFAIECRRKRNAEIYHVENDLYSLRKPSRQWPCAGIAIVVGPRAALAAKKLAATTMLARVDRVIKWQLHFRFWHKADVLDRRISREVAAAA